MTAREMYEFALIEINKLEAPSLLLEDYNYFINKAIQQYINKIYNRYDVNQQSTDDLRVLKSSAILKLDPDNSELNMINLLNRTYSCMLPSDYLHILNCVVEYKVLSQNFKCYDVGTTVYFPARRLTADMYALIINNAYMRPMYKRPYYFLNNVNINPDVVTNPDMDDQVVSSNRADSIRLPFDRQSNVTSVKLEIRYGNDDNLFKAEQVYIDYIKSPMFVRLTQTQIDKTVDTSQVLEFPDYVCFEIVNEFVKLLLENASDPRIQTNPVVNQTIATGIPEQQSQ